MPVEITVAEWALMKERLERLDKTVNGNGKPGLKEEIIQYVDRRDRHKEANARQDLDDLRGEFDKKHVENRETTKEFRTEIKYLQRLAWVGFGIVITIEALGLFKAH